MSASKSSLKSPKTTVKTEASAIAVASPRKPAASHIKMEKKLVVRKKEFKAAPKVSTDGAAKRKVKLKKPSKKLAAKDLKPKKEIMKKDVKPDKEFMKKDVKLEKKAITPGKGLDASKVIKKETKAKSVRVAKFDRPGQRREAPPLSNPIRLFYQSMYIEKKRKSLSCDLAEQWMLIHGLLNDEEAERLTAKKRNGAASRTNT